MGRGGKTGGRQKGTPNKASAKPQAEVEASGLTPINFMLTAMRDPKRAARRGAVLGAVAMNESETNKGLPLEANTGSW